eukprot:12787853-Alexandrium_andersonii.AAC.1
MSNQPGGPRGLASCSHSRTQPPHLGSVTARDVGSCAISSVRRALWGGLLPSDLMISHRLGR